MQKINITLTPELFEQLIITNEDFRRNVIKEYLMLKENFHLTELNYVISHIKHNFKDNKLGAIRWVRERVRDTKESNDFIDHLIKKQWVEVNHLNKDNLYYMGIAHAKYFVDSLDTFKE